MKRRKFVKKLGLVALTGSVLRPFAIKSEIPGNLKKERIINKTNAFSPRVVKTVFQTDDVVIASYNVMDFGAKGDGKTNDSDAIQAALNKAGENGGGVVFIPAGSYALHNRLIIRAGTTLRGDWENPIDTTLNNKNENGTVLMVFADKGKSEGAAFIDILDNAGIKSLTIWYPEQQMDKIESYPFTIRQAGRYSATIENITLVNSYQAIEIGPGNNSLAMVRNVYATALKTGLVRDNTWDVARMQNLHFSPVFWIQSNLNHKPVSSENKKKLIEWMEANGEAVIIRFPAWTWFYNLTIEHYKIGITTLPSAVHKMRGPNGGIYNLQLSDCHTGVFLGDNAAAGFFITGGNIHTKGNDSIGILADKSFNSTAQFNSLTISGFLSTAVKMKESENGALTFMHTKFNVEKSKGSAVDISSGIIEILQSEFSQPSNHISLGNSTSMAYIAGNIFSGTPDIRNFMTNNAGCTISHDFLNLNKPDLEDYEWKKTIPHPASNSLFNVKDYGASGNGKINDAPFIQKTLDLARGSGGTVFLPPGSYLLENELIIPSGVELRGSYEGPHHTIERSGSELIVQTGKNQKNGTPLISLEKNSGIRGLTIFYPEQVWETTNYIPYPWTIQGLGQEVWAKDIVLVNSYQGIDFASYDSKGHVIDYVCGSPLRTGIYLGSNSGEGWVQNIQFIPHYWGRSLYNNKPEEGSLLRANTQKTLTGIKFGYNKKENMLQNFVYGAHYGIRYIHQSGLGGTSGTSMAQGVDGSEIPLRIDGGNDLQFINTQLVPLGESDKKRTIHISNKFSGIARFFNSIFWGQPERSVEIENGKILFYQTNHTAKQGDAAFYISGGDVELVANRFLDPGLNIYIGAKSSVKVIGPMTKTNNIEKHVFTEPKQ